MGRPQRDPPFPYRPGWYPHPESPEEEWYWDGAGWMQGRPTTRASQTRRDHAHHARPSRRARFRVAYDGSWQEEFESLPEAVEYAQEVGSTGRLTLVIEWRGVFRGHRFRAAFPEERAQEGKEAWHFWRHKGWGGATGGGV
jgi:hypothetical protein